MVTGYWALMCYSCEFRRMDGTLRSKPIDFSDDVSCHCVSWHHTQLLNPNEQTRWWTTTWRYRITFLLVRLSGISSAPTTPPRSTTASVTGPSATNTITSMTLHWLHYALWFTLFFFWFPFLLVLLPLLYFYMFVFYCDEEHDISVTTSFFVVMSVCFLSSSDDFDLWLDHLQYDTPLAGLCSLVYIVLLLFPFSPRSFVLAAFRILWTSILIVFHVSVLSSSDDLVFQLDLQYDTSLAAVPLAELVPVSLVYGLTLVLGAVGNLLVIVSICRFRRLQSVTNIFLVSLATDINPSSCFRCFSSSTAFSSFQFFCSFSSNVHWRHVLILVTSQSHCRHQHHLHASFPFLPLLVLLPLVLPHPLHTSYSSFSVDSFQTSNEDMSLFWS